MAKRTRSKNPVTDLKNPSGGYAWEDEYQRTWDLMKDDGDGGHSLEQLVQQTIDARKKKLVKHLLAPLQRGIIRTLVLIIDGLLAMVEKDLRPTRFACMLGYLQDFVGEFFDQNPISQMGIVMMRNGVAVVVSEVSGLPQHHIDKIRALKARQHNRCEPQGDPLLQNALELARLLLDGPGSGLLLLLKQSREILLIFGALFTSDPGDIHQTITALAQSSVRVKVIGLLAQVAICQELVRKTNFASAAQMLLFYGVIINELHFKELLMDCVQPLAIARPGTTAHAESTNELETKEDAVPLIRMGFPLRYLGLLSASNATLDANFPRLCACHPTLESTDLKDPVTVQGTTPAQPSTAISDVGYICPQCRSRVCSLPTVCPVCGLMLILSTHLARSYHHLAPLVDYKEVPVAPRYQSSHCYGCLLKFPEGTETAAASASGTSATTTSLRYRCGKCTQDFCIDCDVFVHEFLHNCPGCENLL